MRQHLLWIFPWLFVFSMFAWAIADHRPAGEHFLEVELNNPYRFGVELEVKCDWNIDKNDFEFKKFYFIKPGDKLKIMFPKYYHECQVWPDHSWSFINKEGD